MTNKELKKIKDDCILKNFNQFKEVSKFHIIGFSKEKVRIIPKDAQCITKYKHKNYDYRNDLLNCLFLEEIEVYYWMSHFIHVPKYSEPWVEKEARNLNW